MPSNLWNFRIGGVLKSEVNNKWISTERVKTILRIEFQVELQNEIKFNFFLLNKIK